MGADSLCDISEVSWGIKAAILVIKRGVLDDVLFKVGLQIGDQEVGEG